MQNTEPLTETIQIKTREGTLLNHESWPRELVHKHETIFLVQYLDGIFTISLARPVT